MKKLLLLIVVITLTIPVWLRGQTLSSDPPREVILLHTNDMHSKIDNMAKLAYLADSLKAGNPDVYLISIGDNFTGNPIVDMVSNPGYAMIDLMNRCGFKVSALGNHEFDMGQELLNKRIRQAKFPFICSNLDVSGAILKSLQPYYVLKTKSGLQIPMLGIIQIDKNGLPSSHPSKMEGIVFSNGITKAQEYKFLKEEYGMLIGLTHLGIEDDINLARSMPQFDLIIGGHSHTLLVKPLMEQGVTILQAGANLKYVGKTTLLIQDKVIKSIRDTLIALADIQKEDRKIRKLIDKYNRNKQFDKVIGVADQPITGLDELGSLMTDALTDQLKTDFAFQNKGGIRIGSIAAGTITLKDIYKLDPFNNKVIIFRMTPDEIGSLICYGYKHEKSIDLQASGMTYRVRDDGNNACASVELFDANGTPLDSRKTYSVAMNNYMAVTYKFDHSDPGSETNTTTAQAIIDFLKAKGAVNYQGTVRATVIAEKPE